MCVNDGFVIFRNSELLSGNLGKKILGGAKNGLFFRFLAFFGNFFGGKKKWWVIFQYQKPRNIDEVLRLRAMALPPIF